MSNICRKLEKTCQNARQRGNQRELAQALEELACYLADQRDWDHLVQVRTELLGVLEKIQDTLELARCHRFIGEAYLELRDPDMALRHVKLYLKLCQGKCELEKQRAFTTLGRVYVAKFDIDGTSGALDKATQFYNSALLLAMKFEREKQLGLEEARLMRGRLLYNLALAASRNVNGSKTEVLKHLERAVYTLKQLSGTKLDKESAGDLYNALCELSEVNSKLEKCSEAVEAAQKALTIARQTKSSSRRAESYMLLGVAKLCGGKWKEGRKALNHARVYAKSLDELKKLCLINNLKDAVRLEKWNDMLEGGQGDRNELNEKIADILAKFGFLHAAIQSYKKVEPPFADKCKRYAAVCGSIAETYSDLMEFNRAEEWYLKELRYREDNEWEELCNVYLSLIACFRKTSQTEKIKDISQKALECAQHCAKRFVKRNVLETLKQVKEETDLLEGSMFENIGTHSDDVSSSDNESSITEESVDEDPVDLSDLSVEISSDTEERATKARSGSRRIAEKKNERGETLLQQECIKGNLAVVQKLISHGFDVNSSDNGGFSCLHDAANHGNFEIVRVLVEAGAVVNKESKDFSHRITPLHSAAADGHYLIVSYLLDHKANAKALTIRGQTAFDLLEVSETEDELYISVRERLQAADAEVRHLKNMVKRRFQHIVTPSPFLTVNEKRGEVNEAIQIEEDVLVRNNPRRKKQKSLDSVVVRSKRVREESPDRGRESPVSSHRLRTPSPKRKRQPTITSVIQNMSDDSNEANDTIKDAFDRTLMCSTPTRKRSREETVIEVDDLDTTLKDKEPTVGERDASISAVSEKSSSSGVSSFGVASVHLVRVRVEDRLLSIPLPRDFSNLTVGYLEQQAADRYQAIEGTRPVVNIALEDGALLCSSDPIVCVQGIPVLRGVVVSWSVPALDERIKTKLTGRALTKKLLHRCQVASAFGKFELDHVKVPQELFVVLKHEVHLHTLKLHFVHLDSNAVQQLSEVFARLKNLKSLSLAGCGLKGKQFLDVFARFASLDLEELDLSFNTADSFFMNFIRSLIPRLKSLTSLSISSCAVTDASVITDVVGPSHILKLDVSCNPLGENGIQTLESLFRNVSLRELDLSNCVGSGVTMEFLMHVLQRCENLKTLKLNGLFIQGFEITEDCSEKSSTWNSALQLHLEKSVSIPRELRKTLERALEKVVVDDILFTAN